MAPRSTLSKLALVCLASSVVPSASALTVAISAAQALGILEGRQTSTCANSTFSRCADTKLPSTFCCAADSTCISLDSSTSALCCPKDADCSKIQPISCELRFQDISARPDAAIKTTRLEDTLASCGSNTCCPFGYSCDRDSQCVIDKATSSTGSSTKSPSASPTSTSAPATTTSPTGIDSTKPAAAGSTPLCPRFPGAAVAVGFFPGMLLGALLAVIAIICLGRHRPHDDRPYSKGSSWSSIKYSNSYNRGRTADGTITGISGPIPTSQGARTDFLRRQPSVMLRNGAFRAKSWFSTKSSPMWGDGNEKHSPLNPVNHWKMPTPPVPNNIPLTTMGKTVPVTPPSQIRPSAASLAQKPSTESIKVYSPPSMVRPPSKSGFSPPTVRQSHGLKTSIMEKLSPFKGTELKAKNATSSPNPINLNNDSAPRSGALDPAHLAPSSHINTTLPSTSFPPRGPEPERYTNNTLQPTQYNLHPANRQTPHRAPPSHDDRPLTHMTTFTDVLRDAGLERDGPPPAMPAMPKGLDWRSAKKRSKKGSSPQKKGGAGSGKPGFI